MAMRAATIALIGLCLIMSAGCRQPRQETARRRIVCSVFPVWLLTRNVAQGRAGLQIELLLPAGLGCPHDYVMTPQDAQKVETADVLVINGRGLDDFAAERFRQTRPNGRVITATEGLADHGPHTHDHADAGGTSASRDHAHEHNPHLFSSPRMAAKMAHVIARGLASVDPEGAAVYEANAARLAGRLEALADEMRASLADLPNRRIITQHDVLDAFAADTGLEIVGYIHAHAGHDPSAQELIELVRTARQKGAAAVMTEPQYSARIGETLAREAGIGVGTLDPVASGPDDAPLDHYEAVMRRNLEVLRNALSAPAGPPINRRS